MKKFSLTLFLAAFLFVSCTAESDDIEPLAGPLDGSWILNNAICYCYFGDEFNFGRHRIFIKPHDNNLRIENLAGIRFLNETGEYPFEISGDTLTFKGNKKYTFSKTENKLKLTYVDSPMIADDEITLEYTKLN